MPPGATIYKVDSSRASFGELWRDTRSPVVLVAWLTKLLRVRLPGSVNDPNVESLRPFQVDPEDLPPDVLEKFQPKLHELTTFGFDRGSAVAHAIVDLFNNSRSHILSLSRPDGRAVARIFLRTEGATVPPKTHFYCDVLSELADGSFLWTTGARASEDAPPGVAVQREVDATPSQLWSAHDRGLAQAKSPTRPVAADGALGLLDRHHFRVRDFQLRRGVFVPMSEAEQEHADAVSSSWAHATSSGFAYPEIYAEMKRLQTATAGGWVSGLLILGISLLLFLVIGIPGLDGTGAAGGGRMWGTLLIIVGVLFFHEMGHYIAMRLFKYRNVRMFFIPMLGAGVTGRNYSAPGWKKVVVALMGPLPGIVVGAILGVIGAITDRPVLVEIAIMALILNGFNLLPVLPLDGGRVMQTLLFSRHYALDVAFRIAAAVVFVGGGMLLPGGRLLVFLGVLMLIGIPAATRVGRIATDLRRQGYGPPPPRPAGVPYPVLGPPAPPPSAFQPPIAESFPAMAPATAPPPVHPHPSSPAPGLPAGADDGPSPQLARIIIDRVGDTFRKGAWAKVKINNKVLAQHALGVYEMLYSRPPNWAASIGFGIVHFGSMAVALLAAIVIIVASRSDLRDFVMAAAQQPRHAISSDEIETVSGPAPATAAAPPAAATANPFDPNAPRDATIIANFTSVSAAQQAFAAMSPEVGEGQTLTRFGQTLLLALPTPTDEARDQWLSKLESRTQDVYVSLSDFGGGTFRLMFIAPTETAAQALVEELEAYLNLPREFHLVPPWSPSSQATDQERRQWLVARRTFLRLRQAGVGAHEDPRVEAIYEQMATANRRGDRAASGKLSRELADLYEEIRRSEIEAVMAADDGSVDREVARQFLLLPEFTMDDEAEEATNEGDDEEDDEGLSDEVFDELDMLYSYHSAPYQAMADRMGRLPTRRLAGEGDMPGMVEAMPGTGRHSAYFGGVSRAGLLVSLDWVTFENPALGAPAMVRWLEERGATSMKYEFVSPGMYDEWE